MNDDSMSVSLLFAIRKTLVFKGYDWDLFCEYASFDMSLLNHAEARIPGEEFERIVQAAAVYTGDEDFGLHQGQAMDISDLGILGYVMLHSKTLGKALEAYRKYNFIVCSNFNASLEIEGEDVIIDLFINHSSKLPSRHCIEDMATSMYRMLMGLSARAITIKEIQFMHSEPSSIEEYKSILGVVPKFNQRSTSMRMSREVLDYPVLSEDIRLLGVFETIAEEVRIKLTKGSLLTAELYKWIIACMPSHFPTLQDAAKELKMSVRTLQAKLKSENSSYNRLANEVRRELAISYLVQPEYTLAEIAYLLHFSEPSAFQTAFKKWIGTAPGEYRMEITAVKYAKI
ncbi:MAG: AraC family transcriptional regulator [Candidatus Pristimantibacillus sp.]